MQIFDNKTLKETTENHAKNKQSCHLQKYTNISIIKDAKEIQKPVLWVGPAKRDLMKMPEKVVTNFGYAIYQAQLGTHPDIGKPLKGFSGTEVIELVQNHRSDTFRAVYTVRFSDAIVVLHAFQKKSTKGLFINKLPI